ncbi:hypothetical protein [Sphingomonas sp.]|uniref:YxiG-like protein n=1 Tax=Sphingomonas sp. TaxID=28214 RepID=UPI0031DAC7E0
MSDDTWQHSWRDELTDYERWEAAGEPGGYPFGTNWSLADPGFVFLNDDKEAAVWSARLRRDMFATMIETDRFKMKLIYHDARLERSPMRHRPC